VGICSLSAHSSLAFSLNFANGVGLSGIGIVMSSTGNPALPFIVAEIDTNSSAFADGRVYVGDVLVEIDGTKIAGFDMAQIIALVRGPPASLYVL